MNQTNYQKELEKILEKLPKNGTPPTLLLHSCCAPCSSYVLEYLRTHFLITVFYYNPNISASQEYQRRMEEQIRLIEIYNTLPEGHPVSILKGDYEPQQFLEAARGLEDCPEGGERCFRCFDLRLRRTALCAAQAGYGFFATTLTISPLKNARKLNEIGYQLSQEYNVPWLPSDFKKKEGYKRSIQLSAQYNLYRQDYCGCAYSTATRENQT